MTTRRALGVVLFVVGAGLAVAGTFMAMHVLQVDLGNRQLRYEVTGWEVTRNDFPNAPSSTPPRFGVPVVVGSLLMVLGAFVHRVRFGALLGAGLVVGATWGAYEEYSSTVGEFGDVESPLTVLQGNGLWLLCVASGAAVVGAVMAQLQQARPEVEPPADDIVIHQIEDDETPTPPYGFPAPEETK